MKARLARLWSFFPLALCLLVWVAAVGWSAALSRALANQADAPPAYPGYQLVWHDEFDVDGPPNPDNWTASNGGFERNHELQWYQPDNVWVEGGHLVIEARRERRASPMHDPTSEDWRRTRTHIDYTSALVTSAGKQAFQYGRFEIRAKIRAEDGLWPAIWTLGVDGPWPARGEIDIMEYYQGQILANAAWKKDQWRWSANWDSTKTPIEELGDPQTWDDDFHVWRMDWDESFIRLYVDGRLLNEIDLSKTYNETPEANNPFRQPHFILLNLALGGDNGGDPSGTDFPSAYLVDYVRVYQPIDAKAVSSAGVASHE